MTTPAEQQSARLLRQVLQQKPTNDLLELVGVFTNSLAEPMEPAIYRATLRDLAEVIDELLTRTH